MKTIATIILVLSACLTAYSQVAIRSLNGFGTNVSLNSSVHITGTSPYFDTDTGGDPYQHLQIRSLLELPLGTYGDVEIHNGILQADGDFIVRGTANGNGSGLTNLNGTNITSGTINSNALDAPTKSQLALAGTGGGSGIATLNGNGTNTTLLNPTNNRIYASALNWEVDGPTGNRYYYFDGSGVFIFDGSTVASVQRLDIIKGGSFFVRSTNGNTALTIDKDGPITTVGNLTVGTNVTAKQYLGTQNTISASAIDWATGTDFYKTLSSNTTFTFSNAADTLTIMVSITDTASNYTVTWPGTVRWIGGVAPTQTVGAHTDVYTFHQINGVIYGNAVQNF